MYPAGSTNFMDAAEHKAAILRVLLVIICACVSILVCISLQSNEHNMYSVINYFLWCVYFNGFNFLGLHMENIEMVQRKQNLTMFLIF
jgi:hypothetical protein